MPESYADLISVKGRYARSVNLERDYDVADATRGYVLGRRGQTVLERFVSAYTASKTVSAFTLTSVYGTGKSAFAQLLSSLCAPLESEAKKQALSLIGEAEAAVFRGERGIYFEKRGFVRAIATARSEPVANTVARALHRGVQAYYAGARGSKPAFCSDLAKLSKKIEKGQAVTDATVLDLLNKVLEQQEVLLVIDELGKNLEFAASQHGTGDLYLLQQIAELPPRGSKGRGHQVYFFGLMHQSFTGYAASLSEKQKVEWAKIQGRFEDINFQESSDQVLRLLAHSVQHEFDEKATAAVEGYAASWHKQAGENSGLQELSKPLVSGFFPMHPVAAKALPILCTRFAQNDRSLFTFLASGEPFSFHSFLAETNLKEEAWLTLKVERIFDYFAESAGLASASRLMFQRWVEISDRIEEARQLEPLQQSLLKTIGVLNLAAVADFKASRELVILSMLDDPTDKEARAVIERKLDDLLKEGVVLYRAKVDEFRLWQGSDFDIEGAIAEARPTGHMAIGSMLNTAFPLKPVVIARHSYTTGTLRYFEQIFADSPLELSKICEQGTTADGILVYYIGATKEAETIPSRDKDSKPVIVMLSDKVSLIEDAAADYIALKEVIKSAGELQQDAVAKRELRARVNAAGHMLRDLISHCFQENRSSSIYWAGGKVKLGAGENLNQFLSRVLDASYNKGIILWNEMINRRKVSTQVSRARGILIEAMLAHNSKERLGLEGDGPETAIFHSLFERTKIFRQEKGQWGFYAPPRSSGVGNAWKAFEKLSLSAVDEPRNVEEMFEILQKPPYGYREGMLPLLLLAILLYQRETTSLYQDGTFIPVIGPEHFELLIRRPKKFAIKHVELTGIKNDLFVALAEQLQAAGHTDPQGQQNASLLGIVKPLISFVKYLPAYTANTKQLSETARDVREALATAREPDRLIFSDLPQALGVSIVSVGEDAIQKRVLEYRLSLSKALNELQSAYDRLLEQCRDLLYQAFELVQAKENMRRELTDRCYYLVEQCIEPRLKRFLLAATDEDADPKTWLESLVMVVADKPTESFKDDDILAFEVKLSDLSRRFRNLELLQRKLGKAKGKGFEARRVTITKPDGKEIDEIIRFDEKDRAKLEEIAKAIDGEYLTSHDEQRKKAILALLAEELFFKDQSRAKAGEVDKSETKGA